MGSSDSKPVLATSAALGPFSPRTRSHADDDIHPGLGWPDPGLMWPALETCAARMTRSRSSASPARLALERYTTGSRCLPQTSRHGPIAPKSPMGSSAASTLAISRRTERQWHLTPLCRCLVARAWWLIGRVFIGLANGLAWPTYWSGQRITCQFKRPLLLFSAAGAAAFWLAAMRAACVAGGQRMFWLNDLPVWDWG